jgi:error-prone DNA polymerase
MFIDLHTHSAFSLLDGVPTPEQLVTRAAELGMPALALTDHDAVYGLPAFETAADQAGVKAILGAELTVAEAPGTREPVHLTVLAEDGDGYANLCQLITLGRMSAPKGEARLPWTALPAHRAGLLVLSGCRRGPVTRQLLDRDQLGVRRDREPARRALAELIAVFGRRQVVVEVQRSLRRGDVPISRALAELAAEVQVPVVATGNVHYLSREEAATHDTLTSIRLRQPLAKLRPAANYERFLRNTAGMLTLYPDLPGAVHASAEIAARCTARLPRGLQVLPVFPTPVGIDADQYLARLCQARLPDLYRREPRAAPLLEKELGLIKTLGLANYFLVVADIVAFCKRASILCHGRGSAANSLVARLLGISAVDPIAQDLVVERFLSVEHGGTPDIDLDIDAARRERVIQYVYERWGRDHAAMACTYVTFRSASALRDTAYALGASPPTADGGPLTADRHVRAPEAVSGPPSTVDELASRLYGLPRHLGIHNGGMVVSGRPLAEIVPIEPATMEARTVVQFDKESLEALGIVKIDLLGLRMLAAIADTVEMVKETRGVGIDLYALDGKDPAVYDQICSAHTIGLFQVESGAQVSIIPHLQPRSFQDLIAEVSLIRPGPLQGNMVRPYINRRTGREPVVYLHPLLKPALAETYGVIVFQEQVIKVARDVAGFTPGRGELLRRALGAKDPDTALGAFRGDFLRGAEANGVSLPVAEQIWMMLKGFAGYSFSKAHAAAFAVIVYWSAWLRVHHPVEYFCGLLRHAPLGTYPAHVLEAEARRCGIKFLPFDVNRSAVLPHVEHVWESGQHATRSPKRVQHRAIRHGLSYIKGVSPELAEQIVAERERKPFASLVDVVKRLRLDRRVAESLVQAGACDRFGERRALLWDLAAAFDLARRPAEQPALAFMDLPDERPTFSPFTPEHKTGLTFAASGVTGDLHLVSLRRDAFTRAGCITLPELRKLRLNARVRVGGLVADGLRRPPTAKGTAFLRLEQPDGLIDVIIPASVYADYRGALRGSAFLAIDGRLQRITPVPSVVAEKVMAV